MKIDSYMTPGHHMKNKSVGNFAPNTTQNVLFSAKSAISGVNSIFMQQNHRNNTGVESSSPFGLMNKRKKIGTMTGRTNTFMSQSNLKQFERDPGKVEEEQTAVMRDMEAAEIRSSKMMIGEARRNSNKYPNF